MRIGIGFDLHPFAGDQGRKLVLGGVEIDHVGLAGHSDGDAVIHAVVDALLGAAGLGDIGENFGTDRPEFRGASSSEFLLRALELIYRAGYKPVNVDVTVIAQRPFLKDLKAEMAKRLSKSCGCPVSVKATNPEALFGNKNEGIGAIAVALLDEA